MGQQGGSSCIRTVGGNARVGVGVAGRTNQTAAYCRPWMNNGGTDYDREEMALKTRECNDWKEMQTGHDVAPDPRPKRTASKVAVRTTAAPKANPAAPMATSAATTSNIISPIQPALRRHEPEEGGRGFWLRGEGQSAWGKEASKKNAGKRTVAVDDE